MKYVIFKTSNGFLLPVIFPNGFIHADMALVVNVLCEENMASRCVPVSAGTIDLGNDFVCSGESETLGLVSRPIDEAVIGLHEQGSSLPDTMLSDLWEQAKKR